MILKSMSIKTVLFFALLFSLGCQKKEETASTCSGEANYQLTFETLWSQATHPTDYPGNAHFSPLIGVTHNGDFTLWRSGEIATSGIEIMAETGANSTLQSEIADAITAGTARAEVLDSQGGIPSIPATRQIDFTLNEQFSKFSMVSMIAPSPDWFIGVDSVDLCSEGEWLNGVVVELAPYDAGTDSGATYASADDDTSPKQGIAKLTGAPVVNGTTVQPFGKFTFNKTN